MEPKSSLPSPPSFSPPPLPPLTSKKSAKNGGRKLPTPKEMIAHYESQGMDVQQASLKVIEDLQNALFRRLLIDNTKKAAGGGGDTTAGVSTGRKLDVINSRLTNLDMKVDMKPGYPQTLAIGVASGAVLKGIGAIVPHLASSVANIWNTVRSSTTSAPH